jgi:hypothetical protein
MSAIAVDIDRDIIEREWLRRASDKQVRYVLVLLDCVPAEIAAKAVDWMREQAELQDGGGLDYTQIHNLIDRLKAHRPDETPWPVVVPGRYALLDATGDTHFYRVTCSEKGTHAGRTFVASQHGSDFEDLRGTAARSVLARIAENPQEASLRYGLELGICGRCGTELTKKSSRDAGVGPVCATKSF